MLEKPLYNFLSFSTSLGILLFVFALFNGGIFISFFSLLLGHVRKIKFYEKLSMQVMRMSFLALVCYVILNLLYGYILIYFFHFPLSNYFYKIKEIFLKSYVLQLNTYLFLASILLFVSVFTLKKFLKNLKGLFIFLLGTVSVLLCTGIYGTIFIKLTTLNHGLDRLISVTIKDVLLPKNILIVSMFWSYLFLSLSVAGLHLTFYLLLRRQKDDFGRDYYKFAIPSSGKWIYSIFFFILILIGETLIVYRGYGKIPPPLWIIIGIMGLTVLITLLLAKKLINSPHPIRLKEIIIVNPFLGIIMSISFVMVLLIEFGEVLTGWKI